MDGHRKRNLTHRRNTRRDKIRKAQSGLRAATCAPAHRDPVCAPAWGARRGAANFFFCCFLNCWAIDGVASWCIKVTPFVPADHILRLPPGLLQSRLTPLSNFPRGLNMSFLESRDSQEQRDRVLLLLLLTTTSATTNYK